MKSHVDGNERSRGGAYFPASCRDRRSDEKLCDILVTCHTKLAGLIEG